MDSTRCTNVMAWRRAVLASPLPLAAKVVAFALHEHLRWSLDDPEAGRGWPATRTLSEAAAMERKSVRRSLDALAEQGYVARGCRRGCASCQGGNGHALRYEARLPQRGHGDPVERGHGDPLAQLSGCLVTPLAGSITTSAGSMRPLSGVMVTPELGNL